MINEFNALLCVRLSTEDPRVINFVNIEAVSADFREIILIRQKFVIKSNCFLLQMNIEIQPQVIMTCVNRKTTIELLGF